MTWEDRVIRQQQESCKHPTRYYNNPGSEITWYCPDCWLRVIEMDDDCDD